MAWHRREVFRGPAREAQRRRCSGRRLSVSGGSCRPHARRDCREATPRVLLPCEEGRISALETFWLRCED